MSAGVESSIGPGALVALSGLCFFACPLLTVFPSSVQAFCPRFRAVIRRAGARGVGPCVPVVGGRRPWPCPKYSCGNYPQGIRPGFPPCRQSLARLPVGRSACAAALGVVGHCPCPSNREWSRPRQTGGGAVPEAADRRGCFQGTGNGRPVPRVLALACGLFLVVGRGSLPVALPLDLRPWIGTPRCTTL